MANDIRAAVVGASGYSGMELARLLSRHPRIQSLSLYSSPSVSDRARRVGAQGSRSKRPDFILQGKARLSIRPFHEGEFLEFRPNVVFFATPNETSHELIPRYRSQSFKIIDLSGSFRLCDASLYPRWYGFSHSVPDLLPKFVYGLPEANADAIGGAQWVANPGCYATSVLLPLLPLVRGGWVDDSAPVVCDSKSGVSGAGKQPTSSTHFCEVSESFKAYSVFSHRHLPEIEQHLGLNGNHKIIFTPHLLPINRGILSTLYLKLKHLLTEEQLRGELANYYAKSPFIRIFPSDDLPEVNRVAYTNFCDIGVRMEADSPWVVMVSCLDNLMKGAAGQAIQNMNLMFGLAEETGLE